MTEDPLSKSLIEKTLADYFGRRHCCLTNRGTTALAAAFSALDRPAGTRAVFPAVLCSVPVFAAGFAGWRPAFADVALEDGNFDPEDLERTLKEGGVGAVVPAHMFGQPDDMERLRLLCRRHGAALVEDVALSMGAVHRGRRAGSFGDLSCLSFVRKMLPLEMGGAVLTDDAVLDTRVRRFAEALPPPPQNHAQEVPAAMNAFHALTGYVASGGWERKGLLDPFAEEFRRLLLARTDERDWAGSIVLKELGHLEEVVQARRVRAEVYETALAHPRIKPLRHEESCFFAYPVRLEGVSAEGFLHFAAERGFSFKRVAYPDVHPIFSPRRPMPNAEVLEREVVGLPVDDDQPVSSFWEYAGDFLRLFREYLDAAPALPPFDWRGRMELRMGSVLR